jgi:hypothetical protein
VIVNLIAYLLFKKSGLFSRFYKAQHSFESDRGLSLLFSGSYYNPSITQNCINSTIPAG